MTKKEIVKTISEEMGLTQLKTKEIVQKTFDAIVETLVSERRIELRNFGVFEVKKRAARKARNPRTGERVDVGEKFVVTFKPGKEMEERVRQLEEAANAARLRQLESQGQPTAAPAPSVATYQPPPTALRPTPADSDDAGLDPFMTSDPNGRSESHDAGRDDADRPYHASSYVPGRVE